MNPDLWLEVLARSDESTISKLALEVAAWDIVKLVLSKQLYWKRRVEHLLGDVSLQHRVADWKRVASEIALSHSLFNSISLQHSPLTVQVLLESGSNPLEKDCQAVSNSLTQPESLRVILSHLVEHKLDIPWHVIKPEVYKLFNLKTLDVLLAYGLEDVYNMQLLDPWFKGLAASLLSLSVRQGLLHATRYLLKHGRSQPIGPNLQTAVELGYLSIVELLLADGRVDPRENSWYLCKLLGAQSYEMRRLFEDDGRLDTNSSYFLLAEAVQAGNMDVMRDEHPNSVLNHLASLVVFGNKQLAILEWCIRHTELAVQSITYSESLIVALKPFIWKRLISAYQANSTKIAKSTSLVSGIFLRSLILQNLTPSQAIDWLGKSKLATRDVLLALDSEQDTCSKHQQAFRAYFWCIRHKSLDFPGASLSSEAVRLAKRLVAAQMDLCLVQPSMTEYRVAFKAIFGV
ncbi:Hypothetical protein POVR2_LOCUS239 [uncultured virus]|nr:Hypothetical protein POVR2_LOCUS239 [uncultured virus]